MKDATITKQLIDILVCPNCKGELEFTKDKDGLICHNCKLVYEIKDGIPIMLIDEAKPLKDGGK